MSDEHDVRFLKLSEIESRPDAIPISESGYRRGYYQGFFAAMKAACEEGKDFTELEDFLYGPLFQWRYEGNHQKVVCPPEVP